MGALLRSVTGRKVIRFVFCGAVTAVFNLALLGLVIEGLGIKTGLGRSIANVVCTEISVLFSFIVYKVYVWRDRYWGARVILMRQLASYHASVATSFVVRTLVAFPLLDAMGIHYTANLLIGIALSAAVNFLISDRFVFACPRGVGVAAENHTAPQPTLSSRDFEQGN